MCVVVVGSSNSLCILQLAFNTCDLEPWSSSIASCVGCCRLRRIGHSMDLGGVLLVSSVSCVFMFVCCGMAVCHFHNLLPTSTVHKPIRFFFASAGLLLSVWFLRCEKKCCDPNTCDTNTNRERDRERQRERQRETQREGQTRDQTRPGSLSLSGASLLVTTCLRCCHKLLQYSVLRNVVDMTRVRPPANTVDVDNADTQALEEPRYRS